MGRKGKGSRMKKKVQVFVSSTYTDLIEERQAAVQAILDAGHIPAGMELFKSGSSQMKTIKKWIDESDVYCLILGGRYGTIEDVSKLSYTQLEYEYAVSKKKPIILIILDDSMLYKKAADDPKGRFFEEGEAQSKYKAFKEKILKSVVCKFVHNISEIETKIHSDLNEILNTRSEEMAGWIKGTKGVDIIHDELPQKFVLDKEPKIEGSDTEEKTTKLVEIDEEIKGESQNPMAYVKRGDLLISMDKSNLQKAVRDYMYAIFLDPECTQAYYNIIQNLTIGMDYKRALRFAEEACRLFPNVGESYGWRAYVKHAKKLYQESIEDCNRAIALSSDKWFYDTRGHSYRKLGQLNTALEDFAMAHHLDAKYESAIINIKYVVGEIGILNLIEAAIEEKKEALKSKNAILGQEKKERFERARTYFECVILTDPDNEIGLQEYGGLYYDFKKYPEALEYWKKALEVHKCCKNYYLCAVAYKCLHKYSRTVEFSRLALKYPDDGYYGLVYKLLQDERGSLQ